MALTWSLALLSAYPHARQRLEDEVDALPGDDPADIAELPWTNAVISEAMRLYPPAWTLERSAIDDDDVCGTQVPAGSMIAVLPYLIHRNPAVWPNPSGFDPDRFLPGAPPRHRYSWIPFGGGKRGCIGAGFARQESPAARPRHPPPGRAGANAAHPARLVVVSPSLLCSAVASRTAGLRPGSRHRPATASPTSNGTRLSSGKAAAHGYRHR